jgi:muconate/chloromuconate cycloisomerase
MKIVDVRAIGVNVPLVHEFKAAYGTRKTADFVLVEIEDDQGRIGLGEASTIPIYDEGSQDSVLYVINKYFKPLLMGKDPTKITFLMELLNSSIKGERYAKCAIDFALHDLTGKIFKLPVYDLLGGNSRNVEVCWVISAKNPELISEEVKNKLEEGFKTFKLKVGTDKKIDLKNARVVRDLIGDNINLRLDGNEAWSPKEAIQRIREFEDLYLEHVEQPVPAWNYDGLKFVREKCNTQIAADECILNPTDVVNISKRNATDRINIKVSRSGGIIASRKMAAIAEASGQSPFAGSMLELGIGTVASAHFFVSNAGMGLATELVGPLLLKKDILKKPIEYKNGYLILPEGYGFGIDLDYAAVKEFSVK